MNKGILLVISGPSGCGKDTIIKQIVDQNPDEYFLSISMTTRDMRKGETDGEDYYYVNVEEFERRIACGDMLEFAKYGNNYYGTPIAPIKKLTSEGKIVILNIEVQGAANVRKLMPESTTVFVVPPSLEVLENRLRNRGTEDEEAIAKRMEIAKGELACVNDYEYVVENDVLATAVSDINAIIKAQKLKTKNNKINL